MSSICRAKTATLAERMPERQDDEDRNLSLAIHLVDSEIRRRSNRLLCLCWEFQLKARDLDAANYFNNFLQPPDLVCALDLGLTGLR